MRKLKVALISLYQHSFDGNKKMPAEAAASGLTQLSREMDFELYTYRKPIVEKAEAIEASKEIGAWNPDFLMIHTASYAAGETLLPLARLNVRLGLWAMAEPEVTKTKQVPLNSFCGINMFAGILSHYLKDYDLPYKWFFGVAEDQMFKERFSVTVRALTAIVNLRDSRVGLIGGIAPGFNDLYFDERLAGKRLGVDIQRNYEFDDIKRLADGYRTEDIAEEIELMKDGFCTDGIRCDSLEINARYYKAHRDFAAREGLDAFAMSCWPKMQDLGSGTSCAVLGKLNQYGLPAACEGDLPAAVSMLLLQYLNKQPPTLLDYIAFDEADDTVLLWHCGPTAECYCRNFPRRLEYHFHYTKEDSYKEIGLVGSMCFDPGEAVIFRFTGEWDRAFVAGGAFTGEMKDEYKGCRGWYGNLTLAGQPVSALDLTNTIMVKGFQHHYPLTRGAYTDELLEICAWLSLEPLQTVQYHRYLQR